MEGAYGIAPVTEARLGEALRLVWDVFVQFDAADYSRRGVEEFRGYVQPDAIAGMLERGELLLWTCCREDAVVGVAALRPPGHLSLLFVDPAHHRRGIARALLDTAAAHARGAGACGALTVHASLYGREIYTRLGFVPTGGEQLENGIRYIPMQLPLGGECGEIDK